MCFHKSLALNSRLENMLLLTKICDTFSLELELNIKFPTCWDGINLEAKNGQNHVVYAEECGKEHDDCFDLDCPSTHPVRMPEIHLYARVLGYEGGAHVFADGSDVSLVFYFQYSNQTVN